jgi:hypothetical protein
MAKESKYKVKRPLVLPTLKFKEEEQFAVRIETAMAKSTMKESNVEKAKGAKDGRKMDPATVCHVTNLDTGERQVMICGSVLESTLQEAYPGDKYVGLCFTIIKHAKAAGKRYNTYSIDEIEDPARSKL